MMSYPSCPAIKRRCARALAFVASLLSPTLAFGTAVVVIGHAGLPRLDDTTVQKIFTGKIIEVGGINVIPVNAVTGHPARGQFLQQYLNQDEEKFVAYWTVRRYIGKGVPPKELPGPTEIIQYVQSVPGAIGYIDESELKAGANINILLRK